MYKILSFKNFSNRTSLDKGDTLLLNFAKSYLIFFEDDICSSYPEIFFPLNNGMFVLNPNKKTSDITILPNDMLVKVITETNKKSNVLEGANYKQFANTLITQLQGTEVLEAKNVSVNGLMLFLNEFNADSEVLVYKLFSEYSEARIKPFLESFNRSELFDKCFTQSSEGYVRLNDSALSELGKDDDPQLVDAFKFWNSQMSKTYFTRSVGDSSENVDTSLLMTMANNQGDYRVGVDYWVHNHPLGLNGLSSEAIAEGHQFSMPNKKTGVMKTDGGFNLLSQIGQTDLDSIIGIGSLAILVSDKGISFVNQKHGLKNDEHVLAQLKFSLVKRDVFKYLREQTDLKDYQINVLVNNLAKYILGKVSIEKLNKVLNRFEFAQRDSIIKNLQNIKSLKMEMDIPTDWEYREVTAYEKGLRTYFVSNARLERMDNQTDGAFSKYDMEMAIQFMYLTGAVQREELYNAYKNVIGDNEKLMDQYSDFIKDLVQLSKAASIEKAEAQVARIKLKIASL